MGAQLVFTPQLRNDLQAFLAGLSYDGLFVLSDTNTEVHARSLFETNEVHWLVVPAGEAHKSLEQAAALWQQLLECGANRHSILLNVGGGMITDLGGYVAGNFKRGIRYINVPTSLLAQVDAAVGGKTGLNLSGVKNAIGLFYEPLAVFFNNQVLSTLPLREMLSGKAEMFKHGLIAEAPLFEAMHLLAANDLPPAEWIKLAVEIKCNIVAADPTEQNERELLNFGHTLGHAIESHSHHQGQPLLHGEAIFIGMLLESRLSTALNLLAPEHLLTIEKCLAAYQPANVVPPLAELMPWLVHDKKNRSAQIKFSLLTGIGEAIYGKGLTAEALLALQTKLY